MKPVSITIDSTTFDLYWTDPVRGTIESCDFYGNNRKVFRTDVNRKYYGIDILKVYYNTVYTKGGKEMSWFLLFFFFRGVILLSKEHTCFILGYLIPLSFQTWFGNLRMWCREIPESMNFLMKGFQCITSIEY
jgi:hypothetical protein